MRNFGTRLARTLLLAAVVAGGATTAEAADGYWGPAAGGYAPAYGGGGMGYQIDGYCGWRHPWCWRSYRGGRWGGRGWGGAVHGTTVYGPAYGSTGWSQNCW